MKRPSPGEMTQPEFAEAAPRGGGKDNLQHSQMPSPANWETASLGLVWTLTGVVTYTALTLLSYRFLSGSSDYAYLWKEVPACYYDRSSCIFFTAFVIDVLSCFFERKTAKLDYVLLPAFIKGTATTTNLLIRNGLANLSVSPTGRIIMLQRYICWMHTTPSILLLVQLISTNLTMRKTLHAIFWDEMMLITGAVAMYCTGWAAVFWGVVSHLAMIPLIPFLHAGLAEAVAELKARHSPSSAFAMQVVYIFMMTLWCAFGVVWDLGVFHIISIRCEEMLYLTCDFSAKVVFSSSLMLGSFKGMEQRRVQVMRHIEESNKQKLIDELKNILEQKDRFLSSVSHELRTPLNGIIGISEGLLSGCCGLLSESVRRQVYIVRTSGARLLNLINDVMDAASLRHSKLVLKQERVVLRPVVDDVLDLTRSIVDVRVELQNAISPDIAVLGDTGRIVQVLNNLLGNAAKFTSQGFIRVSARKYADTNKVVISVRDTGIGIPKNKLHSIFLPFEQVDMSISRKYGGCGLGLNIVQELVRAHRGDIWVQSLEGKGSCFTFTLPMHQSGAEGQAEPLASPHTTDMFSRDNTTLGAPVQVLLDPDGQVTDLPDEVMHFEELPYTAAQLSAMGNMKNVEGYLAEEARRACSSTASPAPECDDGPARVTEAAMPDVFAVRPFHKAKFGTYCVLSVDDDHVNHMVVQTLLQPTYEVVCVNCGSAALEYLRDCDVMPDLMLLDCMMPDMSGYTVCQWVQQLMPWAHMPIIMVSAHAEEDAVVRGLDTGADDYITKPFKRNEFLARIKLQLNMAQDEQAKPANGPALVQAGADKTDSVVSSANSAAPLGPVRKAVLVVDDDDVNQMILENMLSSMHYIYLRADTGEEAMDYFSPGRHQPDLVLLDMTLPDMPGTEVCKMIRQHQSQRELPIIMLTAIHVEQQVVDCLEGGANDYVTKPFRRHELFARIRLHLRPRLGAGPMDAALHVVNTSQAIGLVLGSPAGSRRSSRHQLVTPVPRESLKGLSLAATGVAAVPTGAFIGWDTAALLALSALSFDSLCATVGVETVVEDLGELYDRFDTVRRLHGATRVDSAPHIYMVLLPVEEGGPLPGQPHPLSVLYRMAKELMQAVVEQPALSKYTLATPLVLGQALHLGCCKRVVMGKDRPRAAFVGEAVDAVKEVSALAPHGAVLITHQALGPLLEQGGDTDFESPRPTSIRAPAGLGPIWMLKVLPKDSSSSGVIGAMGSLSRLTSTGRTATPGRYSGAPSRGSSVAPVAGSDGSHGNGDLKLQQVADGLACVTTGVDHSNASSPRVHNTDRQMAELANELKDMQQRLASFSASAGSSVSPPSSPTGWRQKFKLFRGKAKHKAVASAPGQMEPL